MKLLSAQLRNYRIHRDTEVSFDGSLTLVHGPNESGKSTLAEAMHCALFLKSKGNTAVHEKMRSGFGGDPEVRLDFEAAGRVYSLEKRFGPRGNTTLASEGAATLNGEEAESELARLLGVDGAVSGGGIEGKMQRRWAHLWVWQGQSNQTPLEQIGESQSRLREKLQAQTGQTVTSSPRDAAVIDNLRQWVDGVLTTTGKARAGSDLAKAEAALEEAKAELAVRETGLRELREAADNHEQATADKLRHAESLKSSEERLKAIEASLVTVRRHREALRERTRERTDLGKELDRLRQSDADIRKLAADLDTAEAKAAPGETEVARLRKELEEHKTTRDQAALRRENAAKTASRARSARDALDAHVSALQTDERLDQLKKRLARAESLKKEVQTVRNQLAPLSPFTEKTIRQLRKRAGAAAEAKARLDAYALQIEVREADQPITLEGDGLAPGASRTLDHAAELRIGDTTRILLRPGGADDLRAAQEEARESQAALGEDLREKAVSTLEEAEDKLQQRTTLETKLTGLEEKLEEMNPEAIEADLDEASQTLARLKSEREHHAKALDSGSLPTDRKTAEAARQETAEALRAAEQQEDQAQAAEKAARKKFESAETALRAAEERHKSLQETVRDLSSRLKYAVESSGEADARTKAIIDLQGRFDEAAAAEKAEMHALEKIGADQLELDQKRLTAAVEQDRHNLAAAEERITIARTELKSNGSTDPERECKELEARVDQLEHRRRSLRHQADVRQYLLEKLKIARKATTAALSEPLEDKVRPYLQLLFGGSRPKLHWADDGSHIQSFELDRTGTNGSLHSFDELSHGTKEQVALALRLAFAELLAADHDGCLPLVLDDAFTHADRERLEKLKSLLYQASQSGLQILLLSCHPENYSGVGASEVFLPPVSERPSRPPADLPQRPPASGPSAPPPASPSPSRDNPPAEPTPSPAHPTAPASDTGGPTPAGQLLATLEQLGGHAGNRKLREALGWDELYYLQVRNHLIGEGHLRTGRGRGGSVKRISP